MSILTRRDFLIGVAGGVALTYAFHAFRMRQASNASS